jgi:hypothetical protein
MDENITLDHEDQRLCDLEDQISILQIQNTNLTQAGSNMAIAAILVASEQKQPHILMRAVSEWAAILSKESIFDDESEINEH